MTVSSPLSQLSSTSSRDVIRMALREYAEGSLGYPDERPAWYDADIDAQLSLEDECARAPGQASHAAHEPAYEEVDFDSCILVPSSDGQLLTCVNHELRWRIGDHPPRMAHRSGCQLHRKGLTRSPRSARLTDHLTPTDLRRLYRAYVRSTAMGLPINTHVVVSWANLGLINDIEVSIAAEALLSALRSWCARTIDGATGRPGLQVSWIWVHERGPHAGHVHTHIAASVPPIWRPKFGRVLRTFLERHARPTHGSEMLVEEMTSTEAKPMQGTYAAGGGAQSASTAPFYIEAIGDAARLFKYLMKGLDPDARVKVGDALVPATSWAGISFIEPQGTIRGKRCGYSTFSLGNKPWSDWAQRRGHDDQLLDHLLEGKPIYGCELTQTVALRRLQI